MTRKLSTLITLCLAVVVTAVQAAPITLSDPFLFREVRSYQDGTGPGGSFIFAPDVIQIGVKVDPAAGTTGVANTSITVESFPLSGPPACGGLVSSPTPGLCREIAYTSDRANGVWEVVASNGLDMTPLGLGTLGDPVLPPFATDVLIDMPGDGSLDVSWLLPSGTGDANRIRFRIHNEAGDRLFEESLAFNATSIFVPFGVVTDPGTYWARVMLEESGLPSPEILRRASTFAEFQIPVPEPATLLLLGLGLAGLGLARRRLL